MFSPPHYSAQNKFVANIHEKNIKIPHTVDTEYLDDANRMTDTEKHTKNK